MYLMYVHIYEYVCIYNQFVCMYVCSKSEIYFCIYSVWNLFTIRPLTNSISSSCIYYVCMYSIYLSIINLPVQADVVMIDLGTNDYSTEPHPSDAEFTAGLSSFVSALQGDYPGAKVLLLCPYNLTDLQCGNVRSAATATGVTYLRLPTALVSSLGCNYHPDKTSQEALSDFITPLVETLFT